MLMSRFWQDLVLFGSNSDLEKEINQLALIPLKYYTRSTWYCWKSWITMSKNVTFHILYGVIFTWDWEFFSGQESARFEAICYSLCLSLCSTVILFFFNWKTRQMNSIVKGRTLTRALLTPKSIPTRFGKSFKNWIPFKSIPMPLPNWTIQKYWK